MASTVVNSQQSLTSTNVIAPALKRGTPANLGTLTAVSSVVEFSLPQPSPGTDAAEELSIITVGGTITPGLEASIDGRASWFGVPAIASSLNVTTLNADTAASSASRFDVAGLQAGAVFRFGATALTGTPVVWALIG